MASYVTKHKDLYYWAHFLYYSGRGYVWWLLDLAGSGEFVHSFQMGHRVFSSEIDLPGTVQHLVEMSISLWLSLSLTKPRGWRQHIRCLPSMQLTHI